MELEKLVRMALVEDVGNGDVTTEACVPMSLAGNGQILAKERMVVCGHSAAKEVFRQLGAQYSPAVEEGVWVESGATVAQLSGRMRALLTGERVALNLLMRLSGIATHTRNTVAVLEGLGASRNIKVVDTRKSTPLHRSLERRAVCVGGAANHRFALYDGVLIKDNHIAAAGGVAQAVKAAQKHVHHLMTIEIEVETESQADEAVAAGAGVLLLDNMDNAIMERIINRHGPTVLYEASGNMTANRLPGLAEIGVNVVSIGGLIHQARWVDLSCRLNAKR